ncbi:MAG: RNA methyltransferase [Spirochaetales bacterium]|nr:RNA methyltransferase [Spirochaetales bacterium]
MGITITKRNAEFQIIEALKESRKKRSSHREVFIEGIESIKQLLSSNYRITRFMHSSRTRLSAWALDQIRNYPNAVLIELSDELYSSLCEKSVPSELLATAELPNMKLEGMRISETPFILVLDRPSDKGNLGTIIRSANAFGVDAVILYGHCVDPFDPKVIRTSLGAVFHTQIFQAESVQELIELFEKLKEKNPFKVIGTDSDAETIIYDKQIRLPAALVLGNEAKGLSVNLKNSCDLMVRIPISGQVNSLNVACAGTVFLHRLSKPK